MTNLRVKKSFWYHKYRVLSTVSIDKHYRMLALTTPVDATPFNYFSSLVIFYSEGDGGTFIDYGTPNIKQRLKGVEIRNFDPCNATTMSGFITGTIVRKYVGPKFNKRTIVTRDPFLPLWPHSI